MADHGLTSLVLTFHKGSIWGWSASDFERKVEHPLSERDPFDDDVIHFVHALLAPAQDVMMDGRSGPTAHSAALEGSCGCATRGHHQFHPRPHRDLGQGGMGEPV